MRRTWDALAAGETAVYVGDPATGASELAGLFGRLDGDPRGGTCLEVGCGPGRMTGALAERFDQVVAVDVSPAMLERARAAVSAPNVSFVAVSGERLDGVEDGSADTLVCYLVLQHLPDREVVEGYLREFARVLAPGGVDDEQRKTPSSGVEYGTIRATGLVNSWQRSSMPPAMSPPT